MSVIAETLEFLSAHSPPWMRWALCRDADPELFHPEPNKYTGPRVDEAKRICRHCPVRPACLRWAFETGDKWAILGGRPPTSGLASATGHAG